MSPYYTIKLFTKHRVRDGFFDDVDLVVFPGGEGEATAFSYLLKANLDEVKKFLQRGGKYLGICMGAYWADAHYFDILRHTRALQYIKRPGADIKSSYGTIAPVMWRGKHTGTNMPIMDYWFSLSLIICWSDVRWRCFEGV